MKGYFSQLARHTGLGFESGKTSAAIDSLTTSTVAAEREGSAAVAPLHVEEVTFTTSRSVAAADISARGEQGSTDLEPPGATSPSVEESTFVELAGDAVEHSSEAGDDGNPEDPAQTTPHTVIGPSSHASLEEAQVRYTTSESKTQKPQAPSAAKRISASRHEFAQVSAQGSQARQKSGPPELAARVETAEDPRAGQGHLAGQHDLSAVHRQPRLLEAKDREPLQPGRVVERTDAALDEELEREVTFQNYLKEVRAWVAATPETDERGLEHQSRPGARPLGRSGGLFALEQEMNPASSPLYGQTREPEVQDLSLSIGTISIVIEEPKRETPVPQPPARAERTAERITSESTSLSRYYLRSW